MKKMGPFIIDSQQLSEEFSSVRASCYFVWDDDGVLTLQVSCGHNIFKNIR